MGGDNYKHLWRGPAIGPKAWARTMSSCGNTWNQHLFCGKFQMCPRAPACACRPLSCARQQATAHYTMLHIVCSIWYTVCSMSMLYMVYSQGLYLCKSTKATKDIREKSIKATKSISQDGARKNQKRKPQAESIRGKPPAWPRVKSREATKAPGPNNNNNNNKNI